MMQAPNPQWWQDPDTLKERNEVGNFPRPTEDVALANLYNAARANNGDLKDKLDPIEKKVFQLELRSFQECPRYYTEAERRKWISKQSGIGLQAVKDILRGIDVFTVHEGLIREAKHYVKNTFKAIVKEVMMEESDKRIELEAEIVNTLKMIE